MFGVSYYYNFFWEVFYHAYYQDMDDLLYGFTPVGMPEFNWKINILIWLSGIVLMGFVLWLVTDSVCKGHYKKRKPMPLWAVIANQGAATALYISLAVLSGYSDRLYYMPRFLLDIAKEVFTHTNLENTKWLLFSAVFHSALFTAMSLAFYLKERRHFLYVLEREEERRKEMTREGTT